MDAELIVRQMTKDDTVQVKQIIKQSFPIIYRFFAISSIHEKGKVLVGKKQGKIVGFAKLINFKIEHKKYGCILWIAVQPAARRKGIAATITKEGIEYLKSEGATAVFASTQKRNIAAISVLKLNGFRRISFLGLKRIFGWRAFQLYKAIWFAPREVVFIHE